MAAGISVDPSVSREPISQDADGLATVCVLCSHNCGLRVDVRGGRIASVRGDDENPITSGYVCNKAFSVPRYAHHDQRVEYPLRRRADGSFERVSWDDAIAGIAEKLGTIRATHGPRAVGLVGIGGQANHLDGPYGLTWLWALGSKRWFNAFAQEKTQHFLVSQWMFDASPSVFFHPDLEHTNYVLLMGTNPRVSNRGHNANDTFRELAERDDCFVTVVDPRETETTRGADRHVRVRPGTDVFLLLALAAEIVRTEGLASAEFLRDRAVDFEALRSELEGVDVEEMARRCGVPAREIAAVAQEFAGAERAAIMFDLCVEQIPYSTLVSFLIHALSAITGNVGVSGGNVFMESSNPPQRSPLRFEEPERTLAAGIRSISALGGFPMFSPTLVPEEVRNEHPERLRALVVEGANPFLSYSDTAAWREAREALDLLVVIEPAMTETAREADWVLPTPCGYEKWEWATFPRGYPGIYGQLRPPVISGPPEALPEAEIYARLAEAMGLVSAPPEPLAALAAEALEPEGAARYLGALQEAAGGDSAALLFWGYRTLGPQLAGPSLTAIWAQCHENAMLRREAILRVSDERWKDATPFELAAELFRRLMDNPQGVEMMRIATERNFEDHVGFEDGRVRLAPPAMLDEIRRALGEDLPRDSDFPLVLSAGIRTQWNANTIQRDPKWRKGRGPHCALHIGADDAAALGVGDGAAVQVTTRRGRVELPAAIDARIEAGHVWIPNGFGMAYPGADGDTLEVQGVNINELTDVRDRDPITGCPHHKYTLCRVEPLS